MLNVAIKSYGQRCQRKFPLDSRGTLGGAACAYAPFTGGRKIRRGMWIAPIAIVIGVVTLLRPGFQPMGLVFVVVGTALLMSPFFVRRLTIKHYARRPDRDMLVSWEFYPDHILSRTEASSSRLEWRMISRVMETPQGFLLYPNDKMFHWLPIHAFHVAEDKEAFVRLAKARVQTYEEKRS